MLKTLEKYPLLTLTILVVLMLLVHLDVPNLTIMEARNFITAREMVNDNNWLLTTMNGEPRYQKPPLPTWLSAISGMLFGINNLFALRLPAALMILFSGFFGYFLSLKLKLSKLQSFHNSLILVTSFYIIAIINEAPWDIFTHGFMLAGIYFLFNFFEERKSIYKNALLAALFVGLSIMSKGPIGLYGLFLPFILSYAIVYKFKEFKTKILPLIIFIIISLVIGGWWFVYVRLADPEAFIEIATKETGNWANYNVKPFYYYWSFFTQSGLWTIPALISLLYPYLIKRVENKKAYKFTFWWTIISVVLLSIIPEKKARYLVPVLIPLALNTCFYIQYLIKSFTQLKSKKETIPVYFNFGLIAVLGISMPIALFILLKENLSSYITSYILTSLATFIIGIFLIIKLYKKEMKSVFYLSILFMVSVLLFGLPISKNFNKNENFNSIEKLHSIENSNNITTYSINEVTPELLWYYNGFIKNIYKNNELKLPTDLSFGLLIMDEDITEITTKLEENYTLKHVETFNMNVGSKTKNRLIRQFYLVQKK